MSKELEYVPYEDKDHLAEIYQVSGMQFALMSSKSNGNKQCHQWVKCRDFLGDVVRAIRTNKPCNIYKFQYNPRKDPRPYTRKIRLLVRNENVKDVEFRRDMTKAIRIINAFERKLKVRVSTLHKNEDGTVLFEGPAFWIRSPTMLSIYTLLIRAAEIVTPSAYTINYITKAFESIANRNSEDTTAKYMFYLYDILDLIIFNYKQIFYADSIYDPSYTMSEFTRNFHDNHGVLSLVKKRLVNAKAIEEFEKILKTKATILLNHFPIVHIKNLYYTTLYTSFYFEMVRTNEKGFYIEKPFTCREELVASFRKYLKPKTPKELEKEFNKPLEMVFFSNVQVDDYVLFHRDFNTIYKPLNDYLNRLSIIAGFNEECIFKECIVEHPHSEKSFLGVMLKADKKWKSSPILLTMLVLLVREMPRLLKTYTVDQLMTDLGEVPYNLSIHTRNAIKHIKPVMLRYNELFKSQDTKEAFLLKKSDYGVFNLNGINALCLGKNINKQIQARYEKIRKEYVI
jgi:hypothetical protein